MTNWIRAPRWVALRLIAVIVMAAAVAAFAESFRGLYLWAVHHGLTGGWAVAWPLMADTFIAVGELALFVALVDRWQRRQCRVFWTVTALGLVISVAGNVGHAPTHDLAGRVTFAVPPLAAAASLFVGLTVLKYVVENAAKPQPVAAVVAARDLAAARSGERGYAAALAAIPKPKPPAKQRPARPAKPRRQARPTARPKAAAKETIMATITAENLTAPDVAERYGLPDRTARRYVATAAANGYR